MSSSPRACAPSATRWPCSWRRAPTPSPWPRDGTSPGAIYDRHGFLVAQGETDLPAFVGITMVAVPEVLRSIGVANMRPDDIYMINDPYVASTHCNDIHFVRPVFYEDQIIAFVSSTAHWSDVGGIAPGVDQRQRPLPLRGRRAHPSDHDLARGGAQPRRSLPSCSTTCVSLGNRMGRSQRADLCGPAWRPAHPRARGEARPRRRPGGHGGDSEPGPSA